MLRLFYREFARAKVSAAIICILAETESRQRSGRAVEMAKREGFRCGLIVGVGKLWVG